MNPKYSNGSTEKGLHIECGVDNATYEAGIKVSDEELNAGGIVKRGFHGEWNYTIFPRQSPKTRE